MAKQYVWNYYFWMVNIWYFVKLCTTNVKVSFHQSNILLKKRSCISFGSFYRLLSCRLFCFLSFMNAPFSIKKKRNWRPLNARIELYTHHFTFFFFFFQGISQFHYASITDFILAFWLCSSQLKTVFFSFHIQVALIVRKIHPCLPSFKSEFTASVPLTRIRDIAHRNDIPHDLKVIHCRPVNVRVRKIFLSLVIPFGSLESTIYMFLIEVSHFSKKSNIQYKTNFIAMLVQRT